MTLPHSNTGLPVDYFNGQSMTREELLRAVAVSIPFIQQLFPLDCAVAVSDGSHFLAIVPGKNVDPELSPGDPVSAEDVNPEVMRTGKVHSAELSAEAYGVPMRSIVVPIKDHSGATVGTLDIGIDLTTQAELQEIATRIKDSFGQITQSSEDLAALATNLSTSQHELMTFTQQITQHLTKTNSILEVIQNLSAQTNLLGINAAIEAARSGEHGRGFSVVAEEIRSMSHRTSQSAKDINGILGEFNQFLQRVTEYVDDNGSRATDLASSAEEMATTLERNSEIIERLHILSERL